MRTSFKQLAVLALAAGASAFPAGFQDALAAFKEERGSVGQEELNEFIKRQLPGVTPLFDAKLQYVSNQGEHKFVAPTASDKRGPCPGINAMANHGYIPHNGIGTIAQFVTGAGQVFGMAPDLATFLAVYASVVSGDLVSVSIGGPPPSGLLSGLGVLGKPQGLAKAHNKFESDGSPVWGDLYEFGNNVFQMSQFKELYQLGQDNGDSIDLNTMSEFRYRRWKQSVAGNPYYFSSVFNGVVTNAATFQFIYRFMGNKSAEHPQGLLNGETLKSFYAVSGDGPDNFSYQEGHERIPDNWYGRHPTDMYTIPYFTLDSNIMELQHPEFLTIGGNMGKVNTLTGLDPSNLSGGVYNAKNLLEGNNMFCFAVQSLQQVTPDILKGTVLNLGQALSVLNGAIGKVVTDLGCPAMTKFDKDAFNQFPGFSKLKADGSYKKRRA